MKAVDLIAVVSWIGVWGATATAHAEGEDGETSPPQQQVVDTKAPAAPKKKLRPKGNATREKETEGTEAPDRFEADTVIKSQYKLDGKQLEVDPD